MVVLALASVLVSVLAAPAARAQDFTTQGNEGGPFTVTRFYQDFTNGLSQDIHFSAQSDVNWLYASGFSVFVGQTVTSEFDLTQYAGDLPPGVHLGTVTYYLGGVPYVTRTVQATIFDVTPPVISNMPAHIVQNTDPGQPSAVITWTPPTITDTGGITSQSATHSPGDTFPVGTTWVIYQAENTIGQQVSTSFSITVTDAEDPVITGLPADITQLADPGSTTTAATWTPPTASDNVGVVSFAASHSPGDTFAAGSTVVSYTATDAAGNSTVESFAVTVDLRDPDPSQSDVSASPSVILANGTDTSTITVLVRDDTGTLLGRGGTAVTLSTTLGSLGPLTDHGDGSFSAVLTAGTTTGVAVVTAQIDGAPAASAASVAFELDEAHIAAVFDETTAQFVQRRMERILTQEPRAYGFGARRGLAPGTQGAVQMLAFDGGRQSALAFAASPSDGASAFFQSEATRNAQTSGDLTFALQSLSADRHWHGWAEGSLSIYEDATGALAGRTGRFGALHMGADYLVREDLALGLMLSGDWAREEANGFSEISGAGWMAGPYVSGALSETLFYSARLAWGRSANDVSLDVYGDGNLWDGAFSTRRTLARAALSGAYDTGAIRFAPQVEIAHMDERIGGYSVEDSGGQQVDVAQSAASLTLLSLSGEIAWPGVVPEMQLDAFLRPTLDLTLGSTGAVVPDTPAAARLAVGLRSAPGADWTGEVSLSYDGLGQPDFDALSLRLGAQLTF